MRKLLFSMFLALSLGHAHAATPVLTGTVSFDAQNALYTYTYTLDTATLTHADVEFSILQSLSTNVMEPFVSVTTPDDWNGWYSSGGLQNSGASNIYGSFWYWYRPSHLANGAELLVFSFTTARGVSTSTANNYFVYDAGSNGGPAENPGFFEVGNIVAPELIVVASIPEPDTRRMLLLGIGTAAFMAARQRRKRS